jgi:hypothetical protein
MIFDSKRFSIETQNMFMGRSDKLSPAHNVELGITSYGRKLVGKIEKGKIVPPPQLPSISFKEMGITSRKRNQLAYASMINTKLPKVKKGNIRLNYI